jgi:hypothetical protein
MQDGSVTDDDSYERQTSCGNASGGLAPFQTIETTRHKKGHRSTRQNPFTGGPVSSIKGFVVPKALVGFSHWLKESSYQALKFYTGQPKLSVKL